MKTSSTGVHVSMIYPEDYLYLIVPKFMLPYVWQLQANYLALCRKNQGKKLSYFKPMRNFLAFPFFRLIFLSSLYLWINIESYIKTTYPMF